MATRSEWGVICCVGSRWDVVGGILLGCGGWGLAGMWWMGSRWDVVGGVSLGCGRWGLGSGVAHVDMDSLYLFLQSSCHLQAACNVHQNGGVN